MTAGRVRTAIGSRGVVGLALAVFAVLGVVPATSVAAPSEEDVASAKEELLALQRRFEAAVERYNEARYRLSLNQSSLDEAKERMRSAQAEAEAAMDRFASRAVAAYTGVGSQLDGLLDASSITEFGDRLEFIGAISTADAELAAEATNARQVARWAADEYAAAVERSRQHLEAMAEDRAEIERLLDEQESLYEQLEADYESFLAAQRAALEQAAAAEVSTSGAPAGPAGGGGYVPPANASKAQIAVQAAYSVVGTRYVWGSSDPSVGLDCSGVTVYAWGQAGVSLPHSSVAQYASYPRIPLSAVQPGDLVYYGNYGPHIAIYVGGGKIIHASSPAPGGQTRVDSMYGYDEPWGAVRVA
jgi:cell wall-associated NlpC family hydrolase